MLKFFELGYDGPKKLVPLLKDHFILHDVNTFSGGKYSGRRQIKVRMIEGQKIEVVAKWGDDGNTPLIICKESENGRMVALNFWPVSSNCDPLYWDLSTDGDKIMQNSIIWASRNEPKK